MAHFAVPLAGGVLVTVNTRLTAEEIAYILAHCGAKILVADAALLGKAAAGAAGVAALTQLVAADDPQAPAAGRPGPGPAAGQPTPTSWPGAAASRCPGRCPTSSPPSRSTTPPAPPAPKGAVYTHRGAYLNCFGEIIHSRHDENSVYLWTLPMFHCNGWCTPGP